MTLQEKHCVNVEHCEKEATVGTQAPAYTSHGGHKRAVYIHAFVRARPVYRRFVR